MKKSTAVEVVPTLAGTPFAGGYYVGRFFIGADAYALVVSPKGEDTEISGIWNKSSKKVGAALSYHDGAANTAAMAKAGSAIAKAFGALDTGGCKDWYLPSRLEALLLYGEREQLKGEAAMTPDCWYWTSTQSAHNGAFAWLQSFNYGLQGDGRKSYSLRARAVRRVKL
jgi:hypothetical protein